MEDKHTKNKEPAKKIIRERKIEKQLLYILGFAVFLIALFYVANSFFKGMNTFDYNGLKFTKVKIGSLYFYHYSYFFNVDKKSFQYNMFLRLDPRENNVPVEGDDLTFNQRKTYVSINSSALERCPDSILGLADLTKFLADNQLSVAGGNLDFWDAGNKRQEWITCENKPLNKVVAVTAGNETKISADGNCYTVTINNCQVLNATEKFILQSVLDARKNNKSLAKAE